MFLICGEALFDFFAQPDADDTAARVAFEAVAGGSPFNVAVGLARLERDAALLTGMSTDFLGQRLCRVLEREGVDTRYLVRLDDATTLAMVALSPNGSPQYAFYHQHGADRALTLRDLPELADDVSAIHVGSYSLVVSPTAETLGALIEQEGAQRLVSLDPNVRLKIEPDLDRWREQIGYFAQHADLIKVSEEDLVSLYDDADGEQVVRRWLAARTSLVLVTRGERGVTVFTGKERYTLGTQPVEVVDAVGAGDTFQAAVLCWLDEQGKASREGVAGLERSEIERMVAFANAAAGITCTRRGPDLPRRAELAAS
ncbi:carbohydrate kinase family protein [Halotalea alkalilenta]|uniref:carbohydrate kinase family protein n=1 Tax=Halotalea alkalilenta TaxID=376489 RepID=UPI0004851973|nr:carbohydrate kinase [Halotalea alkalilenta]